MLTAQSPSLYFSHRSQQNSPFLQANSLKAKPTNNGMMLRPTKYISKERPDQSSFFFGAGAYLFLKGVTWPWGGLVNIYEFRRFSVCHTLKLVGSGQVGP